MALEVFNKAEVEPLAEPLPGRIAKTIHAQVGKAGLA